MFQKAILAGASLCALATTALAADQGMRPRFERGINRHEPANAAKPLGGVPTWTLKWVYQGTGYHAIFVGKAPKNNGATTVPTYIIPVKLTYGSTTSDPTAADFTGNSPITNTVNSPIFQSSVDYKQGTTDLGTTQYIDAFERAAIWGDIKKKSPNYHVLLGQPTIEPTQSFTVPSNQGTTAQAFGLTVIVANINWFDVQAEKLLKTLNIPANSLPIFVTTQAYLSSNSGTSGCCIGGYHSYTGTQAYSHFTYISNSGKTLAFSQDVSALSHEVGEWMNDPLTNNTSLPKGCKLYENGDPLERNANFGDYNYTVNGFTYHLQDLVLPPYFGAKQSVSIPYNQTFQGTKLNVCQNGA